MRTAAETSPVVLGRRMALGRCAVPNVVLAAASSACASTETLSAPSASRHSPRGRSDIDGQDTLCADMVAEVVVSAPEIDESVRFFTERLGFRIDSVFPADDPRVVVVSGRGLTLRLEREGSAAP